MGRKRSFGGGWGLCGGGGGRERERWSGVKGGGGGGGGGRVESSKNTVRNDWVRCHLLDYLSNFLSFK